jgi:hypothetical protein
MSNDYDEIDRAGVNLVAYRVTTLLRWIFREQPTSDYGIDAHAEVRADGNPTGRLVGLQIKTGNSYFDEPTNDGWIYQDSRHNTGSVIVLGEGVLTGMRGAVTTVANGLVSWRNRGLGTGGPSGNRTRRFRRPARAPRGQRGAHMVSADVRHPRRP